ncbi:MAG: SAM-dependent methyltransferase [Polyangiaceae bacterium]
MAIDTTRAHIGRIYDFMLGGHHNYEVDRQAAAKILQTVPTYPKWARANRWFLQLVASEWEQAGRKRVLDLATGLPTKGHFNELMPEARILFSDNDPISVAYGVEMLASNPNMDYRLADIGSPETIVHQAAEFFGAEREISVGCIGVAYLVSDALLASLYSALHAFCAPGSVMALTFVTKIQDGNEAAVDAVRETIRRNADSRVYVRTTEEVAQLAAPWRLKEAKSLPDWLGVPDMFTREELELLGIGLSGAIFEH